MKKICLYLSIVMMILIFNSCKKQETPFEIPETINNTPAVSISGENFSYAIKAKQFTKSESFPITFTSDSVKVALAVSNLVAGSVIAEVILKDNSKPFYRMLITNYALSEQFKLKNQISKINITFTNFTGDFSFNLKTAY